MKKVSLIISGSVLLFTVGCSTVPVSNATANQSVPQQEVVAEPDGFIAWCKTFFRIKRPSEVAQAPVVAPQPQVQPQPYQQTVAVQTAEQFAINGMFAQLGAGDYGVAQRQLGVVSPVHQYNQYGLTRPEPVRHPQPYAASRVSLPADYRLIYYPGESDGQYASEGGREIVRVQDERMRDNVFAPTTRDGGFIANSNPVQPAPTARAYVSSDTDTVAAAARLGMLPSTSMSQPAIVKGPEYRRACVMVGNPPRPMNGLVRPLGITGNDTASYQAAQAALDRKAGEVLTYFSEFGYGAFVATDN